MPDTDQTSDEQKNTPPPTNLAELANQHLSTIGVVTQSGSKLFLPQLKTGLGGGSGTKLFIPTLGVKPKHEPVTTTVQKVSEPPVEPSPSIDLSAALLNSLVLTQQTPEPVRTVTETKFIAKSDIIKLMKRLNLEDVTCEIDSRHLLARPVPIKARKRSSLARIMTRQYHMRAMPYNLRHVFSVTEKENMPKRFEFTTPSPDDLILKHLKKDGRKN